VGSAQRFVVRVGVAGTAVLPAPRPWPEWRRARRVERLLRGEGRSAGLRVKAQRRPFMSRAHNRRARAELGDFLEQIRIGSEKERKAAGESSIASPADRAARTYSSALAKGEGNLLDRVGPGSRM